jgi:hypothetical protein
MTYEMSIFAIRNGLDPRRYLHSLLFIRDVENPMLYLSNRKYWRLQKLAMRKHIVPILENKLLFQLYFERKDLPLPRYLGHTDSGVFVGVDGEIIPLASAAALKALVQPLIERHGGPVFAKPLSRFGGAGAFRVMSNSDWTSLFEAVTQEGYIFQETVKQHAEIGRMYPYSLNTLRVTTCMPTNNDVMIACARMRFGRGGSYIDNGSQGGFCAGVDLETGHLCTHGLTQMNGRSGEYFEVHPDTGVPIKGFCLPGFAAALNLVRRAAEALPYPLTGWDVGFTPDGPVLTEGNHNPDYFVDEIACGPYATNRVLRSFIDELTDGRGL